MVDRLVAVDDGDYRLPDPVLAALASDLETSATELGAAIDDRFGGVFDVRRFGAVGDGIVNDTAAIQAAIEAAAAVRGKFSSS